MQCVLLCVLLSGHQEGVFPRFFSRSCALSFLCSLLDSVLAFIVELDWFILNCTKYPVLPIRWNCLQKCCKVFQQSVQIYDRCCLNIKSCWCSSDPSFISFSSWFNLLYSWLKLRKTVKMPHSIFIHNWLAKFVSPLSNSGNEPRLSGLICPVTRPATLWRSSRRVCRRTEKCGG